MSISFRCVPTLIDVEACTITLICYSLSRSICCFVRVKSKGRGIMIRIFRVLYSVLVQVKTTRLFRLVQLAFYILPPIHPISLVQGHFRSTEQGVVYGFNTEHELGVPKHR